MSPLRVPYVDFQLGLSISANSIGNDKTNKSLYEERKQFASRRKRLSGLLIYIYRFIIELKSYILDLSKD